MSRTWARRGILAAAAAGLVAKRKDRTGKRLERLTVPKFILPDPDKLPKPPPPKKP